MGFAPRDAQVSDVFLRVNKKQVAGNVLWKSKGWGWRFLLPSSTARKDL